MSSKAMFFAGLVALIWGINFSVIEIALRDFPPVFLSALRFILVAFPAVFFVPRPPSALKAIIGVGIILGVFKFSLLFIAMKFHTGAGIASLLLQSQVFFTIGLGVLLLKEKLSTGQAFGIGLAVVGFVCFMMSRGEHINVYGVLILLLAAICWSVANIIMKQLANVNEFHFMVWISLIPPIPLLILSFWFESQSPLQSLKSASVDAWVALAYVSYFSTLVGFGLWGRLLRQYSTASVAPFALLVPLFGLSTAAIVFGETLNTLEMLGSMLILLALVFCVFQAKLASALSKILKFKPQLRD